MVLPGPAIKWRRLDSIAPSHHQRYFFAPFPIVPSAENFTYRGISHVRIAKKICSQTDSSQCTMQAYDIFATHLHYQVRQATRNSQFAFIRRFVDKIATDPSIPALIAGDMNTIHIDELLNKTSLPYQQMLMNLKASIPNEDKFYQGHQYSVDSLTQVLNSKHQRRLDYIFPLAEAKIPVRGYNQVLMAKSPDGGPLSDHYPVFAECIYESNEQKPF